MFRVYILYVSYFSTLSIKYEYSKRYHRCTNIDCSQFLIHLFVYLFIHSYLTSVLYQQVRKTVSDIIATIRLIFLKFFIYLFIYVLIHLYLTSVLYHQSTSIVGDIIATWRLIFSIYHSFIYFFTYSVFYSSIFIHCFCQRGGILEKYPLS